MNILTKIRLINELNEKELRHGTKPEASWHQQYKDSAWIYAGNLSYQGIWFTMVNSFYL